MADTKISELPAGASIVGDELVPVVQNGVTVRVPASELSGGSVDQSDIDDAITAHNADTTSVHGITDTSALETTSGAQAKVDAHVTDTSAAHAASAISFSPTGTIAATDAQAAIAEVATEAASALSTHESDTTSVHGITDTSTLYRSGGTDVAVADGGTGSSTASGARTNLGLGTIATQDASNVTITGGSVTGITDLAVADGGTGASTAGNARTNLGLGTIATQASSSVSITGGSITGITDLAVADGGTGASDATTARSNLGLGTIATQASSNVTITGGSVTGITDLAVADGGTGASSASAARTNLGLVIGTDVAAQGHTGAVYDNALADNSVSGITTTFTAGAALSFGNVCYLNSSGNMVLADADAASSSLCVGIATASISNAASGTFLLHGIIRNDTAYAFTAGGAIYLSTTAGGITQTAPSGASDTIVVLGVAINADKWYFNPSLVIVEHT